MKFISPKKDGNGFTLLEVLVAVAILGGTLTILLGAVNRNLILASDSKNSTIAAYLAQRLVTDIELEGYPNVRTEEGEFQDYPSFRWRISIEPFEISQLDTEIRLVQVQIIWDEGTKNFDVWFAVSILG
ncbi:MAG: prepilin-type N-terminal cleavage/methylation domain-containing protein [Thermodesulfobacteriota bacterium]